MEEKDKRYKDRFNRWHDKQIEFTSIAINLIFTISVGLAGFLIGQKDKFLENSTTYCFDSFRTALVLLGISVTIGIFLLGIRILSFKLTKDILKARRAKENGKGSQQEIEIAIANSRLCDKLVHPSLFFQNLFFLASVWVLIISV